MAANSISEPIQQELSGGSQVDRVASMAKSSAPNYLLNRYAELAGMPFFCLDAVSGEVLARTDEDSFAVLPPPVLEALPSINHPRVFDFDSGLLVWVAPLDPVEQATTVAVTWTLSRPDVNPDEVVLAAADQNWSQEKYDRNLSQQNYCSAGMFGVFLKAVHGRIQQESRETLLQDELVQLGGQLENTYEEISLLHTLTRNLQISRSPRELAELCLSRIHGRIRSEGNAIWIEEKQGKQSFLVKGKLPFDEFGMARLIARCEDGGWSRPYVKNRIVGSLLGADFPDLKNLVIVPISEGENRSGWILSCNLKENREYGTVEASLLNSVATILGTHGRNIDLYQQNSDLLLSFVRSLVSTLDAKDPYTRGHSERVALIARRIGEEFQLPDEDLHDIYLAGLLHDVGKIGVDDRILRKPGALSKAEFQEIQKHPMLGYTILQGLKNLQQVLPGVRSHHESYDGRGYPDGLRGDEIPLMARILSVADSFDAMGSDRPYRNGLAVQKIEEIFKRGSGVQWDAKVIDAYFSAREDIALICEKYSGNMVGLLEENPEEQPT